MFNDATIVFDLDGTLVDTAPDLTNALNDVLTRRGHDAVSAETIRACVGHGARVMIETALRRSGAEDDIDQMLAEFLRQYEANITAGSRPFPGARNVLERLTKQGATLAVCTNKREYLSRRLLQELGIDFYFAAIAGRDTFAVSKPDPGHLSGVIALAGGSASRAVMVGDSEVDLATAKATGVPFVLVSFGYATRPLDELSAEALIDHFDDLERHAAALLKPVASAVSHA
jgi:phosphoglycolate phosphatase